MILTETTPQGIKLFDTERNRENFGQFLLLLFYFSLNPDVHQASRRLNLPAMFFLSRHLVSLITVSLIANEA